MRGTKRSQSAAQSGRESLPGMQGGQTMQPLSASYWAGWCCCATKRCGKVSPAPACSCLALRDTAAAVTPPLICKLQIVITGSSSSRCTLDAALLGSAYLQQEDTKGRQGNAILPSSFSKECSGLHCSCGFPVLTEMQIAYLQLDMDLHPPHPAPFHTGRSYVLRPMMIQLLRAVSKTSSSCGF